MESRRIEFRVPLPAPDTMRVCEDVLGQAGWRLTGREERVLFGARGGAMSWPLGIEVLLTPAGDVGTAVRCTGWTRLPGFIQRRRIAAHLHTLRRLIAMQTPVSPVEPCMVALSPSGGGRGWAFWRR
jgi:hypothetical protein